MSISGINPNPLVPKTFQPNLQSPDLNTLGGLDSASLLAVNPGNNSTFTPSAMPDAGQDQILIDVIINLLQYMIASVTSLLGGGSGLSKMDGLGELGASQNGLTGLLPPGLVNTPENTPLKEGQERYHGVIIETDTLSDSELTDLKGMLDVMSNDPDGAILLASLQKRGYVIRKDPNEGAIASAGNGVLTLGKGALEQDKAYLLEVLGHEMTHVLVEGEPDTKNQESIASTLGRRIRYRYEGKPSVYQDENGNDVTFDGSAEAERTSYMTGIRSARVNPAYQDLPENEKVLDILRNAGIVFNF